ncbi:hypothetical protein [Streptomyces griseus]|uniref:hypothetical protein n=1 Tax=Streptomyces griseus TaxID=1911 RepID=UPI0036985996
MAKIRNRGEVLGFGVPVAIFLLPWVAYLRLTNATSSSPTRRHRGAEPPAIPLTPA